jgi:hypothetical protein
MSGIHLAPGEKDTPRIVQAIRLLMQGRDDAGGTVTLAANAATTIVTAPNCAAGSLVFTEATTAHAAAEKASGNMYVSAVANGSFTITHSNSAQTDRSFFWTARG